MTTEADEPKPSGGSTIGAEQKPRQERIAELLASRAPRGRTIGEKPKPRVMFAWEGPDRQRVADALAIHAPTIRDITSLDEIRQEDYDVFVTNKMDGLTGALNLAGHLFVISFVPGANQQGGGTADICGGRVDQSIMWATGYLAESVEIPHDVLIAAQDLVNDDLVPVAHGRLSHIYLYTVQRRPALPSIPVLASSSASKVPSAGKSEELFVPRAFLRASGADKRILAAWYLRSNVSEGWVVPSDVKRPWDWVAGAIRHWAIFYRRFPLVGGWWEDSQWQTLTEARSAETRARLKHELAVVTERLGQEIAGATAALEEAQLQAANGARRLLTEKGDALKQATMDALRLLGYTVMDRDQEPLVDVGGKGEDLGVGDPDDTAFDPIIEVKGYDSGAKGTDLLKLLRHLDRAHAAGRSPTAIWWVTNHWRLRPPADRGAVLAGEESVIEAQAAEEVPLAILDSRTLFRSVLAVEEGTVAPSEVRASLRAARGRWEGVTSPPGY